MGPLNPLAALLALLLALVTASLLCRIHGPPAAAGRYASIDGLRGFLAFSVFLYHASCWYFYSRTGQWGGIPSDLYTHFGLSAVAVFFMITSFLFFSKLLNAKARPIDWSKLFTARVLRLVPLYLFAMAVLFTLIAMRSGFQLRVPFQRLLLDGMTWLGFSAYGQPDLNAVADTRWMIAGVTWSLPYEWAFYFALPVGALLLGGRPHVVWLVFGLAGCVFFSAPQHYMQAWLGFVGGMIGSIVVRSPWLCARLSGTAGSLLICFCLGMTSALSPERDGRPVLLLLTIIFACVACGNTLFGILVSESARKLGEMSYSLYLLHGLLLFTVFHYLVGTDAASSLSPEQHWLVILACVPSLVVLCALTYRFIELPGINSAPRINAWLNRRFGTSLAN